MRDLIRFIREVPWEGADSESAFSDLALRSFRRQCEAIPEYGAYARHVGRVPGEIRDWRGIPAVPASAFRSHGLSARAGEEAATFETSGTTISRPGRVSLRSTRLYETSLSRNFARHLLPDGARLHAIVFGPTRHEAPRSSLWFMADHVVRGLCAGGRWIVDGGEPRWERADEGLERAVSEKRSVLLFGTTLLFHAYFERCDREGVRFALPEGSRAMDTGGAKGTRIELRRGGVVSAFGRVLGIPPSRIVNEYGMAEMGSQFYQDALLAAREGRGARPGFRIPPWVRTRVLDPETMLECREGATGLLVHYDLANLEIPLAIQTEDVGARVGDWLTLEGRLPEAERRGCSLPFEQFLERERQRERVTGGEA
jgi:acyl-protein synthetase LuxE